MTFRRWLFLALSVLLIAAWMAPAEADPTLVVNLPDPSTLPLGPRPTLPYVDIAAKKIVDGTRRVDISGLEGRITHLHKVDGGYVVGRYGTHSGLAFISSTGARSSITGNWYDPLPEEMLYQELKVSTDGDRIVFNTSRLDAAYKYRDTVVMDVPSRRIVYRRTFSVRPKLLGFDGRRALLGVGTRALWWTPGTLATELLRSNVDPDSADLSARQYIVHLYDIGVQQVSSIPPRDTPAWTTDWDSEIGVWSSDDLRIAGTGEVIADTEDTYHFIVHDASDGALLLTVNVEGVPQITWDTNSALLIMTKSDGYQLIRCTLVGVCQRVGPSSPSRYGPYVVADRRNS
jgi:hypothetical protein